jgi:hypothetical protein
MAKDKGIEAMRCVMMVDESLRKTLEKIEAMLVVLIEQKTVKDWYSTDEFAQLVGKAEFTVREWCRLGRVHAKKRHSGRGAHVSWVISYAELLRYQREGLLPSHGCSAQRL